MFQKLEKGLGSFRRSNSTLHRDASSSSIASTNYEPMAAPSPVSKRNRAKRREEMLNKLPEEYMQDQFDPVLFELQQLPTSFDDQILDTIVDSRASVLEVTIGGNLHPCPDDCWCIVLIAACMCRLLGRSCHCMCLPIMKSLCEESMKLPLLRRTCR